jgi:RNA polymerase sigma-70 factor (ECF subfamily)
VDRRVRFELLYERWAPSVKAYLLRRCDATAAEDLLAEVFVVCWRRLDELPADPLPWLLGVARRVLGSHRRAEGRRAGLARRLAENAAPAIVAQVSGDRQLGLALERLSESDRELLLLIAWDGLAPAQAAAALGVKPSTLRVRLLRARRRLRDALSEQADVESRCLDPTPEVL